MAVMAYNNWFSLVLRMVENQINFEVFQMDNAMNEANPREELTHTIRLKLLQRVAMQARGEYESLGYRHSLVVADSGSGAIPATDSDDEVGLEASPIHQNPLARRN